MFTGSKIIVRHQFPGIHSWENCVIRDVDFLAHPHRHMFHVELVLPVKHDDRDLEFFMVKAKLANVINKQYSADAVGCLQLGSRSCEMIAKDIINCLVIGGCPVDSMVIRVFEDNENGAEVSWSRVPEPLV